MKGLVTVIMGKVKVEVEVEVEVEGLRLRGYVFGILLDCLFFLD